MYINRQLAILLFLAAHCVTNEYGESLPKENYFIAAGKFYNNFNDSRDEQAQYSQVNMREQSRCNSLILENTRLFLDFPCYYP